MRYIKIISLFFFLAQYIQGTGQQLISLQSGRTVSIRGLSVVNDRTFWVSGSNGTVGRSLDGGNSMEWMTVTGYEKRDFRDVEAIDEHTAVIMGIDTPAIILRTTDGGKNWEKVFEDTTTGMFLDAMYMHIDSAAIKKNKGKPTPTSHSLVVIGDPIKNKLYHAWSTNGGQTWERLSNAQWQAMPDIKEGEAFFASSGSNITISRANNSKGIYAVSGGTGASLWTLDKARWTFQPLPIIQGGTSTGANAIAFSPSGNKAVIVGGDFAKDTISTNNCVLLEFNKGKVIMSTPNVYPHGFRSSVVYVDEQHLVAAGTSGIDVSEDGGKTWRNISGESYHVIRKAHNGKALYLAGGRGRIAILEWK